MWTIKVATKHHITIKAGERFIVWKICHPNFAYYTHHLHLLFAILVTNGYNFTTFMCGWDL